MAEHRDVSNLDRAGPNPQDSTGSPAARAPLQRVVNAGCGSGGVAGAPSGRRFRVRIHLERLREHLALEDGNERTPAELYEWLAAEGFEGKGDLWVALESDIGALQPEEVLELTPLDGR